MKKRNLPPLRPLLTAVASLLASALGVSSCAPPAYVNSKQCSMQKGPGYFYIPAKLDLVLAADNTGSMDIALAQLQAQMSGFLEKLDLQGWDHRFTVVPLTETKVGPASNPTFIPYTISQIMASKFDSNWQSRNQWQLPFPGATPSNPIPTHPTLFRFPEQFTAWVSQVNSSVGSDEQGFRGIYNALSTKKGADSMIRPDSLLAVFMVGNGNDTSYLTPSDYVYPYPGAPPSVTQEGDDRTFNQARAQFVSNAPNSLTQNASQFKFYSMVSSSTVDGTNEGGPGCSMLGGTSAKDGARYRRMSSATGGASYNVCSQSISTVLNDLAQQLQVAKTAYRTRYVIVSTIPVDTASISQVLKNGACESGSGVAIPNDPNNGWTYAGYVTNVPAIDYPIQASPVSGYAIELHGTAKLEGDETLQVVYTQAGTRSSHP